MVVMFPLFHGTNSKALHMSEEERKETRVLCLEIADLAYEFLYKHFITDRNVDVEQLDSNMKLFFEGMEEQNDEKCSLASQFFKSIFADAHTPDLVSRAFRKIWARKENNGYFQYGAFYLTPSEDSAKDYAESGKAFGEVEWIARYLLDEACHYGEFTDSLSSSEEGKVHQFLDLSINPGEPIVLRYKYIPEDCLLKENGEEMSDKDWNDLYVKGARCFRVKDGVDLSKYKR